MLVKFERSLGPFDTRENRCLYVNPALVMCLSEREDGGGVLVEMALPEFNFAVLGTLDEVAEKLNKGAA